MTPPRHAPTFIAPMLGAYATPDMSTSSRRLSCINGNTRLGVWPLVLWIICALVPLRAFAQTARTTAHQGLSAHYGWQDPDGSADGLNVLSLNATDNKTVAAASRIYNTLGDPAPGANLPAYNGSYTLTFKLIAVTPTLGTGQNSTVTANLTTEWSGNSGTSWTTVGGSSQVVASRSTPGVTTTTQAFTPTLTFTSGAPVWIRLILNGTANGNASGGQVKVQSFVSSGWSTDPYAATWSNIVSATLPTISFVAPVATSGRAVVSNRQPLVRATLKSNGGSPLDTTNTRVIWRGTAVPTAVRSNRGLVEWDVDSTQRLNVGDSALVQVSACALGGAPCDTASLWAVLPNDNKPVLGFTGMPLEGLGRHFSAPFGRGFSVNGGEVEAAIGTPPYFSMGIARGAGLVYSTRQSYPRALIPVDLEVTWPAGTPDTIQLTLIDKANSALRMDSVVLASPTCATGAARTCRLVLDADFSTLTFPPLTRKWMTVEARIRSGATVQTNTDSVEIVLVDRRSTMYGSGWWPAGFLKLVGAGSDRVLVDPSGSAAVYRGNGDSLYLPPPGVFSTLVKVGSGWELRARSSPAKIVFDANGRLQASVDANGNRDSIAYVGTSDEITAVVDPVGKQIFFSQTGFGKFSFFTDPGSRETKVVIDNTTNQLTYDSISSATLRPYTTQFVYQTYPGTQTVVLRKQIGVINDSTVVKYDSTFKRRPIQVTLSPVDTGGGTASPIISYTAYERQGYHALRSLDSVYVETKDPRGNWTRSLLNRWGEARKTWDALGLLGQVQYTSEGFVQWSEGKVADSSRVYNTYDAIGQLARTYIIRATGDTLRTDSLVYDSNHRVIKDIDSRGKASLISYDGVGNVISTTTPHGDIAKLWYRTDGLLDSTRAPGDTFSTRFTYDATWKVRVRTRVASNQLVDSLVPDHFGRDSIAMSKTRVQVGTGTSTWQWRRHLPFYSVANQVDSTRLERTDNCSPCDTPPAWPAASDTTKTQRVAYRFDRAGRDSLRLNDRGATTGAGSTPGKGVLYLYDVLGRVRSRHPWWSDSTAVVDSLVYDIAGNLKKTITRRGDVITVSYDSRNRDTLSVIPGVGTVRNAFAGPLDQLTRVWLVTPVDSIHDVNSEVRFGYDQRGRLKADTSYAGALPQVTTPTYDTYERPATMTDSIGTWSTRYETDRGLPDTLLTPLADTVTYSYDTKGRATGPNIKAHGVSGGELDRTPSWGVDGVLSSLANTVPGGSGYNAGLWIRYDLYDDINPPMVTEWTGLKGVGATPDTVADSLVFDGWERLTSVQRYFSKHNFWMTAELYSYDRTGNVKTSANEAYDILSDRLTSTSTCTYRYDRAGNDTSRTCGANVWTYQYDALNRLRSARYNGTLIVRYGYDVLGRRIAKRVYSSSTGGSVGYTRFVYHGSDVAFEADSADTIRIRYVRGPGTDDLLAIEDNTGAHYYVVQDKVRSVRGLVRRDGTWIRTLRYKGYGAIDYDTASASAPSWELRYQWTGRELDKETGLYFFRSRYYDPGVRGFIQEDPAGYGAGGNLYAYGNGSPLNGRDPSGMMYNADPYGLKGMNADEGRHFPDAFGGGGGSDLLNWDDSNDWNHDGLDDWFEFKAYSWAFHSWYREARAIGIDRGLATERFNDVWYHGILDQPNEAVRNQLLSLASWRQIHPIRTDPTEGGEVPAPPRLRELLKRTVQALNLPIVVDERPMGIYINVDAVAKVWNHPHMITWELAHELHHYMVHVFTGVPDPDVWADCFANSATGWTAPQNWGNGCR